MGCVTSKDFKKQNAAQQSVYLTGGTTSANALVLGDARWRLARPICGIFGLFLHPNTPLRGSPALGVLSTPAHQQSLCHEVV
jgi:hypothetical protein